MAADPGGRTLGVEGVTMLDKMFVHVLAMERTDAWLVEANTCAIETDAGCRAALLRQLEIVGPRLVLAMGTGAALLGLSADRGRWQRWTDADVLPTWHPNELLARPADKRGAMEHLTQVRGRL
jgi:uracil-DNA glycosylase